MMMLLGPLVLWWDGGGKGERFIQMVKPHIKRGIREDVFSFFVQLLDKLYHVKQMELFNLRYGLCLDGGADDSKITDSQGDDVFDVLNDIADALIPPQDVVDIPEYKTQVHRSPK